jgi:hypothetical protein
MAQQPVAAPAPPPSSSYEPDWGVFVGGVLLGSTIAAGAAYLTVRYYNGAATGPDGLPRSTSNGGRRRPGR